MGPWKRSHSENSLNVIVSGQVAIDNNGVTTDNSAMDSALQRKKSIWRLVLPERCFPEYGHDE